MLKMLLMMMLMMIIMMAHTKVQCIKNMLRKRESSGERMLLMTSKMPTSFNNGTARQILPAKF